ncbi:MAG: extracellular solute-binding protein [Colwellia sp.]
MEAKKVTLHFWYTLSSDGFFNDLAQQFSDQHTDIDIITENYPTDNMASMLIFSMLKKEAPDIVLFPSDLLGYYSALKLGEVPSGWFSKAITKELIQLTGGERKHYGIPIYTGNHLLLFYNKSLINKPATTWQEMAEQAPLLMAKGVLPLAMRINKMYWFIAFLNAYDGFPIVNDEIVINRTAMIKALNAYKFLLEKQLTLSDCDLNCTNDKFFQGDFAYSFNGLWSYRKTKEKLAENFGITVLPTINGLPLKPMRATTVLAFPNNALHNEKSVAIEKFSMYLQSYAVQQQFYERVGVIPAHRDLANELTKNNNNHDTVILAQLKNTIAMPASPAMSALWPGMTKTVALFLAGELSAEQATVLIENKAERELKKIKRLVVVNNNE